MTDHDVWRCRDDVYDVVLGSLIKTYKWHAHAPYRLSHKSQLVWSLFAIWSLLFEFWKLLSFAAPLRQQRVLTDSRINMERPVDEWIESVPNTILPKLAHATPIMRWS